MQETDDAYDDDSEFDSDDPYASEEDVVIVCGFLRKAAFSGRLDEPPLSPRDSLKLLNC